MMPINPLDTIHKPNQCLLLIALPITEADFCQDLVESSPKDYAKVRQSKFRFTPHALWKIDHLPLVNLLKRVAKKVESQGVTVRWNVTLSDLADLSRFQVVTLMTHYAPQQQQIELFDKLHDLDIFVEHLDARFTGILDLSVCHSSILQDKIKQRFEHQCFTKANLKEAELKVHLIIYQYVIQKMALLNQNYLETAVHVRKEIIYSIEEQQKCPNLSKLSKIMYRIRTLWAKLNFQSLKKSH